MTTKYLDRHPLRAALIAVLLALFMVAATTAVGDAIVSRYVHEGSATGTVTTVAS